MKIEDIGKEVNNFLHEKGITKHHLPTTDDERAAESNMNYFDKSATSSREEYLRKKEVAGFSGEIQEIQIRNILGQGYEAVYKADIDGHKVQGTFYATVTRGAWSLSGDSEVTVDGAPLSKQAANIFSDKYADVIMAWGFLHNEEAKAQEVRVEQGAEAAEDEQRHAERVELFRKRTHDERILAEEQRRLEASARDELDKAFAQSKRME